VAAHLREARRGDEIAVAEVHVRSWQEAYREIMPADFLAALDPKDRAERYEFENAEGPTTVVAVEVGEEEITGFVTFGGSRDADAEGLAEIYALYVDPGRYGAGVGRKLMVDARERLQGLGFDAAVLWVLQGNDRAASFYEGEGWRPDGATRVEQPYGIVSKVRRFRKTLD
jgi:ribosomal protein S18 acetylase RimI-like enzyme